MRLVDDWHWILTRAWSVRFLIIAGFLSALEVVFSVLTTWQVDIGIPAGAFAALAGFTTFAALIARFVAQERTGAE